MIAKENPFRSERVEGIFYRQEGFDWERLLGRIAEMRYRCSIVGSEGAGKTTLLEEIRERLKQDGLSVRLIRINRERKVSWSELKGEIGKQGGFEILLLDGSEQLSWVTWYRLKHFTNKQKMGLIITSHREGMLPLVFECRTSEGLLGELLNELVGESSVLTDEFIDELYLRHGGNIRMALRELYDIWAEDKIAERDVL